MKFNKLPCCQPNLSNRAILAHLPGSSNGGAIYRTPQRTVAHKHQRKISRQADECQQPNKTQRQDDDRLTGFAPS